MSGGQDRLDLWGAEEKLLMVSRGLSATLAFCCFKMRPRKRTVHTYDSTTYKAIQVALGGLFA